MITPNQLEEAKQELSDYDLGEYKIPKEIQAAEKDYYVCVCVRASDTKNKMKKQFNIITRYFNINHWNKMQRGLKKGEFQMVCNDLFDLVVIMHNPTLKAKKKVNKVKELSPTQKSKLAGFLEDDMTLPEMAKALNVSMERLQAHFE